MTGVDRTRCPHGRPPYAMRQAEDRLELNYAIQIAPWWTMQPDLQYIVRPNGGQSVEDPTVAVGHAFYGGVRTTVKF